MITIQPQYLTLAKLLDGRLFTIPEYQRAYSWTKDQRSDLFGDISRTHAKGSDEGHFMAAVVGLRRKSQTLGTDEFHVMEVVDGQQRLTTLIILLKSIALNLNEKTKPEAKLMQELQELLVKVEGDELLLLQTNHDSSQHFANYLRSGTSQPSSKGKTLADREILGAIEDCNKFVLLWVADGKTLPELIALLKNRLFFLLHEIDSEKAVYTVFEVLNTRGLDVSWIDRLKSILMGAAFELKDANQSGIINDLHTTWRDIYAVIGLRQGLSTEALRYAATLWATDSVSRPLGEKDSVDQLRFKSTTAKNIRATANWLLRVTQAYDAVTANSRINAVTRISQARLLATAINLREDLSVAQRKLLLARWEKVSFRIYGMLRNDARTRVGDYVRLAWQVINDKLPFSAIDAAIGKIGSDFPIDQAVASLRESNRYEGWENEIRYLMFRYEEYLAKQQNLNFSNEQWEKIWMVSPSESIEHIWAKSKAPEKSRHRLGNLVLLPPKLNSKLQNIDPKKKIEAYNKTGLLIAGAVSDVINAKGWNGKTIVEREEIILTWAAKEWAD
ncbi:MAG: DUF262 domain-containing HNH endonuclease family protein [Acidobacteriota bacterium]